MKPKLTINQSGNKYWFLNGKLHRMDGPAVIYYDSSKLWYLNNNLHRTDGPAIIDYDSSKLWYLNDKEYPQKTWFNLILSRYLK